jgi:RHS repeat-associated protein
LAADKHVLSDVISRQGGDVIAHAGLQVDAEGRINSVWEIRAGRLVRQLAAYDHDSAGDLTQARDENGAPWQYQYSHHLLTRYTDRTGRGITLEYDGTGPDVKAVHEWADDGSLDTRLEWNPNIRLTYVTDALGNETRSYYDILGYPYRTIHPDGTEEWFFRDDAKNVTQHVHPDGSSDHYSYDEHGNLKTHVRADGSQVQFEYDQTHRLTKITDPEGGMWQRSYDERGHLVAETDPRGLKTAYAYDDAGRPVHIVDAKGGGKRLTYTRSGQLASYTDCSGRTSQWQYDERGRLTASIDALKQRTELRYTPVTAEALAGAHNPKATTNHPGQLQAVIHPDGTEERLCHDAEGRLLAHTDALERSTSYRYGLTGLITRRIDANGHRLNYKWDKLGRLEELRNENGQPYTFAYDPAGRLLKECGFDGKSTEYRYDEGSGVLTDVIEGQATTKLEFDGMGRLTRRQASANGSEKVETFGYNGRGQLVEAANADAKLAWFYDEAGNLTREHQQYPKEGQTAVWQHRYNELNQRVATTRPGGHTLEWLTYGSGHVHGLVLDGHDIVGFERDALHREVHRQQGNGLQQAQSYDPVGRLLEQHVSKLGGTASQAGSGTSINRTYRYDRAGQLTGIMDSRRGQLEYRYDPVGRLLAATGALGHEVFAFDPASNIVSPEKRGTKLLDNLLKDYAGTHYEYDERGNLIRRTHNGEVSSFEWDAFNRMVKATTKQGVTTFAYDPLGRRIAKHGTRGKTLFGWDGDVLAFESSDRRSVHYVHEAGSFVPLAQATRRGPIALTASVGAKELMGANGRYDINRDPLWNGEAEKAAGPGFTKEEIAYYQVDHLGTPQELTDHEGNIAWAAQYKAWGQAREVISDAARKAGIANPIRFQGQYFDEETGLHYNRYRYYDPHAGRYVSSDPIGLLGGANLHRYVPSPTEWTDPLALAACPTRYAAQDLPKFRGKSRPQIESTMAAQSGWLMTRKTATSTEYKHSDGSYVRIDAYGNVANAPYGSANNAHVHKQVGSNGSCKFNDRGVATTDPNETHIGMKNPKDLPAVRGRPHGLGGAPKPARKP